MTTNNTVQAQQPDGFVKNETIIAIATPSGRGGVGVIRISGKDALSLALKMTSKGLGRNLTPRTARLTKIFSTDGALIDHALVLYFPGPNSFTGEDVIEFHCHGGAVLLDFVIDTALVHGAVLAKPGEFSERAFHNNKIDLVQAEAIADLIDSQTRQAVKSAAQSLQGRFSGRVTELDELLVRIRVYVEACIDFTDEEIEFLTDSQLVQMFEVFEALLNKTLNQAAQGQVLRDGIRMALVGAPNVGKSSLLNALVGDEVAIVTSIAGTTRDVLKEVIHIDGVPLHISDTAGVRHSDDLVEQQGIKRTIAEVEKVDVILCVVDAKEADDIEIKLRDNHKYYLDEQVSNLVDEDNLVVVVNKIDSIAALPKKTMVGKIPVVWVSATQALGLDLLTQLIVKERYDAGEGAFSARKRHLHALESLRTTLITAKEQLYKAGAVELFAEDLKQCQNLLGTITGAVSADDLLGKIFSSFCIGK